MPKICIVTPDHLAVSSRAVKEADALVMAGYEVTVVFGQGWSELMESRDAVISSGRSWSGQAIRWGRWNHGIRWVVSGARQRVCRTAWARLRLTPLAPRATGRVYPELARAAANLNAALYVGHFPAGLAAAGWAASRSGALLAFDSEDYHLDEGAPRWARSAVEAIQRRYLPRCAYITSSSAAVGRQLERVFPSAHPVTLYNVPMFPEARQHQEQVGPRDRPLSLYWVSQTIGLDRGLQDAVRAVALVGKPVELHLRGAVAPTVKARLQALAASQGLEAVLHFHPQLPPWELLGSASQHDVGLALEQPVPLNRELCATIKIFIYLAAGLAVAATATTGQREVLEQAPAAAALYPAGDFQALAAILRRWQENPASLADAKRAALWAARTRFNWESESRKLVAAVDTVFERKRSRNHLKLTPWASRVP